jgi:steroid delta-isomerase-like uncharacterized protein
VSNDNKQLVVRWFEEVWNKGRAGAIDEMILPHTRVHGLSPQPLGPDQFKQFYAGFRQAFPDITITVDGMVAEGDMVAARFSARGTHRADTLGFAATNRPAQFTGMVFVRVENGKLVEGWNCFDRLGMIEQLGMVMRPE